MGAVCIDICVENIINSGSYNNANMELSCWVGCGTWLHDIKYFMQTAARLTGTMLSGYKNEFAHFGFIFGGSVVQLVATV